MSNEPIALGGGPIALGGGPIALGSTNTPISSTNSASVDNQNSQVNGQTEKKEEKAKPTFRFADEVKIGDETLFTIPVENIFYEENNQRKRRNRWGERPDLKKKVHQDVVFNPYQALTGGSHLLPITDGRDPTQIILGTGFRDDDKNKDTERKRSSKWGPDWEKTFQPPIYHQIPKGMTIDDVEYLIRLHRLDEITRNLNLGELEMNDPDVRSPSPDPVYDKNGVRVNTRVVRAKEKLIREKTDLIEECAKLKKSFVAPADYKPPKKAKKIFLPESDGPDNHYIGMVLGPKGATQKKLEGKTGCKISVRGKGSSKQKRMEYDSDEKLHVYIQADTDEQLEKGAQEVEKILRGDAEETTEAQKAKNLQVAAIGSALGDDFCTNCSESGHKSYACPHKFSYNRSAIKCAICGDRSHPTSDCPQKKAQGAGLGMGFELAQFMASLDPKKQQQETRMSTETTSFITNTAKPVLALTFGGGAASNVAYPQNPLFPSFGMQQMQQNPMMNNTYTQAAQPARQQTGSTIYSAPQEPTRPQAYSMSTNTNAPYFINPMMMNYIPQNMQGANNGLTIMSVNPNAPMGVTGMGMPNMQQQNPQMQAGMQGYQYNNMNTANFQGYTQNSYMNPQK